MKSCLSAFLCLFFAKKIPKNKEKKKENDVGKSNKELKRRRIKTFSILVKIEVKPKAQKNSHQPQNGNASQLDVAKKRKNRSEKNEGSGKKGKRQTGHFAIVIYFKSFFKEFSGKGEKLFFGLDPTEPNTADNSPNACRKDRHFFGYFITILSFSSSIRTSFPSVISPRRIFMANGL